MENEVPQSQTQPPSSTPPPVVPSSEKKSSKNLLLILALFVVLALVGVGIYIGFFQMKAKNESITSVSPSAAISPTKRVSNVKYEVSVAGTKNNKLVFWNPDTDTLTETSVPLPGDFHIRRYSFSPDRKKIAVVSQIAETEQPTQITFYSLEGKKLNTINLPAPDEPTQNSGLDILNSFIWDENSQGLLYQLAASVDDPNHYGPGGPERHQVYYFDLEKSTNKKIYERVKNIGQVGRPYLLAYNPAKNLIYFSEEAGHPSLVLDIFSLNLSNNIYKQLGTHYGSTLTGTLPITADGDYFVGELDKSFQDNNDDRGSYVVTSLVNLKDQYDVLSLLKGTVQNKNDESSLNIGFIDKNTIAAVFYAGAYDKDGYPGKEKLKIFIFDRVSKQISLTGEAQIPPGDYGSYRDFSKNGVVLNSETLVKGDEWLSMPSGFTPLEFLE